MCKVLQRLSMCLLAGILAVNILAHVGAAHATTFKVLHFFSAGTDGSQPVGGLVVDRAGNLYGTTFQGGSFDCGTVFELPHGGAENPLYDFTCGEGGEGPIATLTVDQNGNLYGSTELGGSGGCGIIFEVTTNDLERTVHVLAGPPRDGCTPLGALIEGANRKLYGTTGGGGKGRDGTVFELARSGSAKLLHSFKPGGGGNSPAAGVIVGGNGDLYGTNVAGGEGFGNVFQLTPARIYHVLYTFEGSPNDGSYPWSGVIRNAAGDLFGVTEYGGKAGCGGNLGCGVVFGVARGGSETVLHFFSGKHGDGANPSGGLIADSTGNLYGTTEYGGGHCAYDEAYGCGTVFELAPDGTETILYSFSKNDARNGALPEAGLVADGKGNYYGTATFGGAYGYGTVFEITP